MNAPATGFTTNFVDWSAWVEVVTPETASPEQAKAIAGSALRSNQYTLACAQAVEILNHRTALNKVIMYGPGGVSRAERELTGLAVSRFNGCPYCVAHHARSFGQLAKDKELARRLAVEGTADVPLDERRRAIVDFAVKLSQVPPAADEGDVEKLRAAGLSEAEIVDVIHVIGMFAWGNRLLQTLGEPEVKDADELS